MSLNIFFLFLRARSSVKVDIRVRWLKDLLVAGPKSLRDLPHIRLYSVAIDSQISFASTIVVGIVDNGECFL